MPVRSPARNPVSRFRTFGKLKRHNDSYDASCMCLIIPFYRQISPKGSRSGSRKLLSNRKDELGKHANSQLMRRTARTCRKLAAANFSELSPKGLLARKSTKVTPFRVYSAITLRWRKEEPNLLFEAHAIVGFEIINEGGLSRIKSERCAFSSKPFFAFGILVRTYCFD
jgi:hypothetical protein